MLTLEPGALDVGNRWTDICVSAHAGFAQVVSFIRGEASISAYNIAECVRDGIALQAPRREQAC